MSLEDTIKPDDWRDVKVGPFEGLNKALDPDSLKSGQLVRGDNLRLVDDTIVPAVGYTTYHDTAASDPIVGDPMTPFRYKLTDGTRGQVLFTTAGLYRDTGSAWLAVSGGTFTGSVDDRFSIVAVPWADVIVFTNGLDPVQIYDPSAGTISNLVGPTGGDIVAKALAIFDSSLWLLNTTETGTRRPQRVRYCDQGDITEWVLGTAGFRDLLEGTEQLMCGRLLGSYLILYRERGIHRVSISDSQSQRFDIDHMIPDNGVTSIDGVIHFEKNRHFIWGRDNFYLYDGGFELEPIGDNITKLVFEPFFEDDLSGDTMFAAEDTQERHKHHLVYFEELNEILCVFQSIESTDLDYALCFRYGEKQWYTRKFTRPVRGADSANAFIHISWDDLVGTWDEQTETWDELIGPIGSTFPIFASTVGGTNDTPTFQFDVDLTDDLGINFEMVLETKDFSEYPYHARTDWLDLRIKAPSEVVVYYSVDEGVTWTMLQAFTTAVVTVVRLHKQILYESLRFRLNGADFELKSMNLRITPEDEIGASQPVFAAPQAPVLVATEGSVILDMSCTRGSVPVKDFRIYRSIDGGAYSLIATEEVETIAGTLYSAQYTDDPTFDESVSYYVVARDTLLNLSADSNIEEILAPSGIMYVVGASGSDTWRISEDGETWTDIGAIGSCIRILWMEPRQSWVALGGSNIWTSDVDATIWTDHTPVGWGVGGTNAGLAYDPIQDVLVAAGDSGDLFYSLDGGVTWTDTGISNVYSDVAWDQALGLFVIPHSSTSQLRPVFSSPDGVNWTQHADINSMGSAMAVSDRNGTVLGVPVGSSPGVRRTQNGSTYTDLGNHPISFGVRHVEHDGNNYGMAGTIGANSVFARSPTGANGSWAQSTVATSAQSGTIMHITADPTRGCWWVIGRIRVYKSTDSIGSGWTAKLVGGSFSWNCMGIRHLAPSPMSFNVTVAALSGSSWGYELGVGGAIDPDPPDFFNGAQLVWIAGYGASGFEFYIINELLALGYTQVVIETAGGNVTLNLYDRDDGYFSSAESWYFYTNNLWSAADIGQVRTVTFQ